MLGCPGKAGIVVPGRVTGSPSIGVVPTVSLAGVLLGVQRKSISKLNPHTLGSTGTELRDGLSTISVSL